MHNPPEHVPVPVTAHGWHMMTHAHPRVSSHIASSCLRKVMSSMFFLSRTCTRPSCSLTWEESATWLTRGPTPSGWNGLVRKLRAATAKSRLRVLPRRAVLLRVAPQAVRLRVHRADCWLTCHRKRVAPHLKGRFQEPVRVVNLKFLASRPRALPILRRRSQADARVHRSIFVLFCGLDPAGRGDSREESGTVRFFLVVFPPQVRSKERWLSAEATLCL